MTSLNRSVDIDQIISRFDSGAMGLAGQERIALIATRIREFLSGTVGDVDPPDEPEGFVATGGQNIVTCSWPAVDRAVVYQVFSQVPGSPNSIQIRGTVFGTEFLDTGVTDGDYIYWLVAENVNGDPSPPSEGQFVTVTAGSSGTSGVPVGFAVAAQTDPIKIQLSWTNLLVGTVAVEIQRATGNTGTFGGLATGAFGLVYNDTTVEESTLYRYRVRGVAADGTVSAWSSILSATTASEDTIPPPVPVGVTATPGDGLIQLSWDSVAATDLAGYRFAIGTSTGVYTLERDITETSVTIPGLVNGTTYFLAVRSRDTSGNLSAYSTEVSTAPAAVGGGDTTPPAVPSGLAASGTGPTQITLTWDANTETDLRVYLIQRSDEPGGPWTQLTTRQADQVSYVDNTATEDRSYYYRIAADDTSGNVSDYSQFVSARPGETGTNPGDIGPGIPVDGDTGGNSSTLGITAQYNEGSTVHQYIVNSARQNGELFIEGMRSARTGRIGYSQSGTVFNRTDNYWQNIVGQLYRIFRGSQWDFNQARGDWPLDSLDEVLVLANTEIGEVGDLNVSTERKWNNRRYNVPASLTIDTDFKGRLRTDAVIDPTYITGTDGNGNPRYGYKESGVGPLWWASQKEHCVYDSLWGSMIMMGCTTDHIGGHLFYGSSRQYDNNQYGPDNRVFDGDALCYISNCHAYNTELDASRGSGAVQMFDIGSPPEGFQGYAIIRNSTFVQEFPFLFDRGRKFPEYDPANGTPSNSHQARGCLDITQFDFCTNPTNLNGDNPGQRPNPNTYNVNLDPHTMNTVLVQNCLFDVTNSDRDMITLDGIETVIFENCLFIRRDGGNPNAGGNISVNFAVAGRGTKKCGTVSFRNCRQLGGVQVKVWDTDGSRTTLTDVIDSENYAWTIDATNANVTGAAWNWLLDATDPATIVNAVDPFGARNLRGFTFDWDISGVTV